VTPAQIVVNELADGLQHRTLPSGQRIPLFGASPNVESLGHRPSSVSPWGPERAWLASSETIDSTYRALRWLEHLILPLHAGRQAIGAILLASPRAPTRSSRYVMIWRKVALRS
jgi:hypothetical protein